ncbi:MAG: hypothetical protein ACM31C_13295 [Acidobacteriota bacterium]
MLPAALVVSVAVHAGAFAWVLARHEPPKLEAPPAPAAHPAPEPPPIGVVLLDGDGVSGTPGGDAAAVSQGVSRRIRSEVRSPKSEVPPKHSPWMTMREPELQKGPSESFVDHFLAHDKPGVDPDRLGNQSWIDHASAGDVEAAREERIAKYDAARSEELKPSGGGTYRSHHDAFEATTNADGTVKLKDAPDVDVHPSCLFGGCAMSLDDWAMRKAGIDPYRAAKLQWLDKTRDERAEIGRAHRKAQLARSAELVQQNLAWMWQHTRDPEARKQALFEMWDEIAETGDDELVRGGAAARAYLIGFIRSKLPPASPGAFSARELAELNARRKSRAVFAPYE